MITYQSSDAVFQALAHESRRRILDIVKFQPGCSVGVLANHFDVSRIAVMNHLTVLERAGLITSEKTGRTRHLYINIAPLQMIYDRWTDDYSGYFAQQLTGIKYAAELAHKKTGGSNE